MKYKVAFAIFWLLVVLVGGLVGSWFGVAFWTAAVIAALATLFNGWLADRVDDW